MVNVSHKCVSLVNGLVGNQISVNKMSVDKISVNKEEEILEYNKAKKIPQFAAALSASVTGFIIGNLMGWVSPVQPQLQDLDQTGNPNSIWYVCLSDDDISWIGSLIILGALCGAMIGGTIIDRWGCKRTFIVSSLPIVFGWLMTVVSVHTSMIFIGCFVAGFFGGLCSVGVSIYVGEVSTPSMRGLLGFLFQLFISLGMVTSSLLALRLEWRLISAILEVSPFLLLVGMIIVPESPLFLLKKGRRNEALESLRQLRGTDFNCELELRQLESSLSAEMKTVFHWSVLLQPWAFKPIAAAFGVMFFIGLSGINAASFNAVDIFRAAGSSIDGGVCAIILNTTQAVCGVPAAIVTKRVGRRTLYLLSHLFCGIAMATLGTYFYFEQTQPENIKNLGWLPLVSLIIFSASFSFGIGPVPWVMVDELVPSKVKGVGVSMATLGNWSSAFIVTKTFIYIQNGLTRAGAFWMFSGLCICGVLFSFFLLPETKDKSPEEIQAFFGKEPVPSSSSS